jgi:hypothetical protein
MNSETDPETLYHFPHINYAVGFIHWHQKSEHMIPDGNPFSNMKLENYFLSPCLDDSTLISWLSVNSAFVANEL